MLACFVVVAVVVVVVAMACFGAEYIMCIGLLSHKQINSSPGKIK